MASIENTMQVSPVANAAPARRFTLAIYAATLFFSALLIFAIQPMFTKMVLPKLGGAPSVWSVAMVVFQSALFLGYVYAHVLARWLTPGRAAIVHLLFLAAMPSGRVVATAARNIRCTITACFGLSQRASRCA